jgi:hypothetical protein
LYFNTSDRKKFIDTENSEGYLPNIDYYNPKDGSVVNFDSTKCRTTTYYGHLGPVLTGISQETKQNNFVEEQEFLLEDFLLWIGNQVGGSDPFSTK